MTVVLQVPTRFANLEMLAFHVQQHHGYFFGDIKNVREGRSAHAQMHDGSHTPGALHMPVAHVHADVSEITVLRM